MTSTVTLLELLVQPYRDQKEELTQKIFALTSTYPKIEWVSVSLYPLIYLPHGSPSRARPATA